MLTSHTLFPSFTKTHLAPALGLLLLAALALALAPAARAAKPAASTATTTPSSAAPALRAMKFQATTPEEALAWQKQSREKLITLMMGGKMPERGPLDIKVLSEEHPKANYIIQELSIQTLPDRRAHCWLALPLEPKKKVGGILAIHGHSGFGTQVVHGDYIYWYGRLFAELGYAVIAPDVGQHELQHKDWTLDGERVWDCMRALDVLAARPEVDPNRLAVVGLSLGGELTMYMGALDERLKLVDAAGVLTTMASMHEQHCMCWLYPGLEENFDFADIFSLIAPRELICENGKQEPLIGGFPISIAQGAHDEIMSAYKVFGAAENFQWDIHPGPHVFSGKKLIPRLAPVLGQPE